MLTGTNLTYTKAYNFRIVFETVRLHGPISRADIARRTNLTAQTVSNIVTRLLESQFVQEGKKLQKKRGAPSTTLVVNPSGAYSVGLDFNRDHLTGILVDLSGAVKTKIYYEIDSPSPEKGIELMVSTINQLTSSDEIKGNYFCGVGIGLPGPLEVNKRNEVNNGINTKAFPEWKHVPVGDLLAKHINAPIFIENNASAATIGERWYGAGKNISNFVYSFFGDGLGGGLILNGNLYEGHNQNAGEFGYFPFLSEKSPLSDSKQPHIGEHFNLSKLYKWLREDDIIVTRPEDLGRLFLDKNERFLEWLELAKGYLASAFMFTEYLFDIEVIILGGRLPHVVIEDIAKDVPGLIGELRSEIKTSGATFVCGTAGVDAAALGAATLPMFDLFSASKDVLLKKESN
ncbi:MAG: ROK family transcriptional regulator [Balneolaceae bacterium]|nr:ROK family transcriptional regulator [Balneolaceae bacterium]MBO6547029.1 ROK family transcriptional regulator [Balneolaceae bacterium]MBO6648024.1 ROK family transcriptional regulator [Balneolaceae bacterium]